MKLPILIRIIVLVAFLGTNYLKADEEKTITLKDLQGRELLCEIVSKTDSSVAVTDTNGQKFEIPLDKLDRKSRSLIADWSDPALELFKLLHSNFITTLVRADDNLEWSMSFRNLAKEYGLYTEFGDYGLPESRLSFASLLFASQDFSKDRVTGNLISAFFSGTRGHTPRDTNYRVRFTFSGVMGDAIQEWPTGLPYYILDDFKNLRRALYQNQKDIAKRIEDSKSIDNIRDRVGASYFDWLKSKFFISQDVRKYSKRIVNVLKPYQDKLGLPEQYGLKDDKGSAAKPSAKPKYVDVTGTGFAVTKSGYIVTNAHVLEDARRIKVKIAGSTVNAELVSIDRLNDLALIKVAEVLTPISLGANSSIDLGDEIIVAGFPNVELQGTSVKITKGVISSLKGIQDDVRWYQIDASIQPGNSGGPLMNSEYAVVGVVNAKLDDKIALKASGSIPQNVNYSIKLDYLLPLLKAESEVSNDLILNIQDKRSLSEIANNSVFLIEASIPE